MATYTLLDKTILTGTQASITFSGLGTYSPDYTDLKIVYSARSSETVANDGFLMELKPNNSSASTIQLWGNGSSTGSNTAYQGYLDASNDTASTFCNGEIYITNYASTTQYKSFSNDVVRENNATNAGTAFHALLYASNTAISSFVMNPLGGSFVQYSSFYLYGISNT